MIADPPPGLACLEVFQRLDIRVGRILRAEPNPKAHSPALCLWIDFGPEVGEKQSSARITDAYAPDQLPGRLVLGVVNFPPRRVAGFKSEVLVLGIYSKSGDGPVILIAPDAHPDVKPGDRMG